MKYTEEETLTFSTGRTLTPNRRIIGIDDELKVFEGYDNDLYPHPYSDDLAPVEKIELADFMISLWTKYKENI